MWMHLKKNWKYTKQCKIYNADDRAIRHHSLWKVSTEKVHIFVALFLLVRYLLPDTGVRYSDKTGFPNTVPLLKRSWGTFGPQEVLDALWNTKQEEREEQAVDCDD